MHSIRTCPLSRRGVEAASLSPPKAGSMSEQTICINTTRRTGALNDVGNTISDDAR
jgi:hypothetical protein